MTDSDTSSSRAELLAILPVDRQGDWLAACLLCGGGRDISITQVTSVHEAASVSRHSDFDLLILWQESTTHQALANWRQLEGLTSANAFVALGMHVCEGWHVPLYSAGALACCDMDNTDPITLVHTLRTAIEVVELRRERHQWQHQLRRLHQREARDIDRLLTAQKALLARLENLGTKQPVPVLPANDLPVLRPQPQVAAPSKVVGQEREHQALQQTYRAALRSFLFDESQPSGRAVALLAEACGSCGMTSAGLMRLHLEAVEELTHGAGTGGLRHYLSGADRFLIEVLLRMVDRSGADSNWIGNKSSRTSPLAAA